MSLQNATSRGQSPPWPDEDSKYLHLSSSVPQSVFMSLEVPFHATLPHSLSSQCRHLHNILVGGPHEEMSIALWGHHWRRRNADDCRGDLAALAIQGCLLIHPHVQTGAAKCKKQNKKTPQALSLFLIWPWLPFTN